METHIWACIKRVTYKTYRRRITYKTYRAGATAPAPSRKERTPLGAPFR